MTYQKKIACVIIMATLVRCLICLTVGLGNDEAYYFTYALQPDWNHFDHPPLIGIFIRLFTLNLHWVTVFSMRLTGVLAAAFNTWLIGRTTRLSGGNEQSGLIAAVIYNLVLYTSIICGVFALPDSPQLVFWLLAVNLAIKINSAPAKSQRWLLLFGIYAGLAIMCKVHGIFLWFGLCLYIFRFRSNLLRSPWLYIGMLMTCVIIAPIFWWNIYNHYVTWQFHAQRVSLNGHHLNVSAFLTAIFGQLLYNNPFIVLLFSCAVYYFIKTKNERPIGFYLLVLFALPIILMTTFIALIRPVLPHWSGPGFIALIPITAIYIEKGRSQRLISFLFNAAKVFMAVIVVLGPLWINCYPGTMSKAKFPNTGALDVSLDMYGWSGLRYKFQAIRQKNIHNMVMQPDDPILIHKWFPGGHLLFYLAYPLGMRVVGVGQLDDLHKFVWLNTKYGQIHKNENAYFITSSNYLHNPIALYKHDFSAIKLEKVLPQYRSGSIVRYWFIFRLMGAKRDLGQTP